MQLQSLARLLNNLWDSSISFYQLLEAQTSKWEEKESVRETGGGMGGWVKGVREWTFSPVVSPV